MIEAIEALRVPTEAMLRAGGDAWHKADPHDAAALVWGRMIEAALADVDQRTTGVPDDPVVDAQPASRSWPVPDDFWP